MVRRRRRDPDTVLGVPADLAVFEPSRWPGTSEYQRWAAWADARRSWADANLPDGMEDMPDWDGEVPDMPWDEVEI